MSREQIHLNISEEQYWMFDLLGKLGVIEECVSMYQPSDTFREVEYTLSIYTKNI